MDKLMNALIVIAVILSGICGYLVYEHSQLAAELQITKQNSAFVIDSLTHKADSIQTNAIKVTKLRQDDSASYRALSVRYEQSIASLRAHGHSTTIVYVADSSKDTSYIVPFDTTVGIAKVWGQTQAFKDTLKKGLWSVNVDFDTLHTQSELIQENGIWKIRTTSLTPGLRLQGFGTIDQKLFSKIVDIKIDEPKTWYLGGSADWNTLAPGAMLRINNDLYGVQYIIPSSGSWLEKLRISFYKGIF